MDGNRGRDRRFPGTAVCGGEWASGYPARSRPLLTWDRSMTDAAARARARLRQELSGHPAGDRLVELVLIAAGELVANAHEHAPGPYQLRLTAGPVPRIEVLDRGSGLPPRAVARARTAQGLGLGVAGRGRGLIMVHRATGGAWGSRAVAGGHSVWAELGGR
ncbi:ATP-binding protein [Streptomyces monticola]|uniref:ATP-binding protein n=1 Tax=Streptomyces monticola TaxID=2666263 RepID=A0ABW2JEM4_9ACTN